MKTTDKNTSTICNSSWNTAHSVEKSDKNSVAKVIFILKSIKLFLSNDWKIIVFNIILEEEAQNNTWNEWDEENLLKVTKEFSDFKEFMKEEDKEVYFQHFINWQIKIRSTPPICL